MYGETEKMFFLGCRRMLRLGLLPDCQPRRRRKFGAQVRGGDAPVLQAANGDEEANHVSPTQPILPICHTPNPSYKSLPLNPYFPYVTRPILPISPRIFFEKVNESLPLISPTPPFYPRCHAPILPRSHPMLLYIKGSCGGRARTRGAFSTTSSQSRDATGRRHEIVTRL